MKPTIPQWPAIIKLAGDNELTYVSSATAWREAKHISAHPCQDEDILIDSRGQVFKLHYDSRSRQVALLYTDHSLPLTEFSGIVQMHLAVLEQCCISKLTFNDYAQGIELVAASDDA